MQILGHIQTGSAAVMADEAIEVAARSARSPASRFALTCGIDGRVWVRRLRLSKKHEWFATFTHKVNPDWLAEQIEDVRNADG